MSQASTGRLAETYSLIYAFLTSREHSKAAKAVKKAAKESELTIDKTIDTSLGTSLENIVYEWRELSARNAELEELKEHLMEEMKVLRRAQKSTKETSEEDDSSSASESEATKSSSSSSSSSESSSEDEEKSKPAIKPKINGASKKAPATLALAALSKPKNDRSFSSMTANTQEEIEVRNTVLTPLTPQAEASQTKVLKEDSPAKSPPPDSTSDSSSDDLLPKKRPASALDDKVSKRRKLENGAVESKVVQKSEKFTASENDKGKKRNPVPFQRIKVEKVDYHDERLMDNSFAGRGAGYSDYGAKASADLIVTKGAGFRKEKNKKKRGSYRGGEITMQSHSIKFE